MADIQLIQCRNQQKTSSYRRNIVPYKEIGIKESNDVRTITKSDLDLWPFDFGRSLGGKISGGKGSSLGNIFWFLQN